MMMNMKGFKKKHKRKITVLQKKTQNSNKTQNLAFWHSFVRDIQSQRLFEEKLALGTSSIQKA